MRTFTALLFFLVMPTSWMMAQEYEFYEKKGGSWERIPDKTTVTRSCPAGSDGIDEFFGVKCVASESRTVWARRQLKEIPEAAVTSFCWNGCMGPNDDLSYKYLKMDPGVLILNQFDIHFRPGPKSGNTLASYSFFDRNHLSDSAYFLVLLVSQPTGIEDPEELTKPLTATPNPASYRVHFKGIRASFDGSLVLANLVGQRVCEVPLRDHKTELDLDISSRNEGIYFYYLEKNGNKGPAGKLIIRH